MPAVIRPSDHRRTETPNATMTTLASPTLGPTTDLSLWSVEMAAGAEGPMHVFDAEQIWTVLDGAVTMVVGDDEVTLMAGDTAALPAGSPRQVTATAPARLLVCGPGTAIASVPGEDRTRGTPPWIA